MSLEAGRVSVVIVSAGRQDLLTGCLESLQQQSYGNYECFVFLNQASPETAQLLSRRYPGIHFDYSFSNELYCKPLNRGIAKSRGEFVLCLNDDVILLEDFIEEALKVFKTDSLCGAVSGCIMREDRTTIDTLGFFWRRDRKPCDIGYGRPIQLPEDKMPGRVFGVNGAVAFYRRSMLEAIKIGEEYYDEDYGIYYDDFDVAWRAQRAGWKALYAPQAMAIHKRGATTRDKDARKGVLSALAFPRLSKDLKLRHMRNRYSTILKNDSLGAYAMDFPWILLYEIRLLVYLLIFDFSVLLMFFQDLSFVSRALEKRRKILQSMRST